MAQLNLFSSRVWEALHLPDGNFKIMRSFLDPDSAQTLFDLLYHQIDWRQDHLVMYGKRHKIPRLHQWFGDRGTDYSWSGIAMASQPWIPELLTLRHEIEAETGLRFNSALANLYRDGNDTVNWHSDDEQALGPDPCVASLSLGATRDFLLKNVKGPNQQAIGLPLSSGSLLLMGPGSQLHWRHKLPRRKGSVKPRINLTFRWIELGAIAPQTQ